MKKIAIITLTLVLFWGCHSSVSPSDAVNAELSTIQASIAEPGFLLDEKRMDTIVAHLRRWGRPPISKNRPLLLRKGDDWLYCINTEGLEYINPALLAERFQKIGMSFESEYFQVMGEAVFKFRCQDNIGDDSSLKVINRLEKLSIQKFNQPSRFLSEDLSLQLYPLSVLWLQSAINLRIQRSQFDWIRAHACSGSSCHMVNSIVENESPKCRSNYLLFCGELSELDSAKRGIIHVAFARQYF